MTKKQINKAVNLLTTSVIDDIIKRVDELSLKEKERTKVLDLLNEIKTNKKKRDPPKIALEKQCTATCKSGLKCTVPICDKTNKICWAHMNKNEREEYRLLKIVKM